MRDSLYEHYGDFSYEVIVVNKGLDTHISDRFLKEFEFVEVIEQESNGLSKGIVEGIRFLRGDTILVMDCDGSHAPEDLYKFLKELFLIRHNKFGDGVVLGSRYLDS